MRKALAALVVMPLLAWAVLGREAPPCADQSIDAPEDVCIPLDLDDAFSELKRLIPPAALQEMQNGTEEDMGLHHFGLGTSIRNKWGLWEGSRLSSWFNDRGISHPDDMSGIILKSFWRHLNGKPIELQAQVQFYKDYWEEGKNQDRTQEQ